MDLKNVCSAITYTICMFITSKYVQRIETYYNSEKSDKNKVDTNPDKNMDIFSKVDEAAPRTDSDEDIDVDDPQPETKKLIKKQ